jgi:hypothetical protein
VAGCDLDGEMSSAGSFMSTSASRHDSYRSWSPTSSRPAHALIGEELIDRHLLMIHPVVLWTGKSLFEPGVSRADLRLSESVCTPGGVPILTFVRADGEATAG